MGCVNLPPPLLPKNEEPWRLWCLVQTQWRVSFNGPIGLDYVAVIKVAEVYGIKITPKLFRRIQALEFDALFLKK